MRDQHRAGCVRSDHPNIGRRRLLEAGGLSLFGLGMSDLLRLEARAAAAPAAAPKARSVVFIFQSGGPSQHETWDPKPAAPAEIRGDYGTTATRLAGVKWQRCQFHLAHNLLDYLPPNVSQEEASAELRGVFNAPSRAEAERLLTLMVKKYATVSKKLAAWLETAVPEGLTVFDFPIEHRRRLRTNNSLERLNREIKRRTRVATLFPNEASLLRLATAVLMETDEEWQSDKRYLSQVTPSGSAPFLL